MKAHLAELRAHLAGGPREWRLQERFESSDIGRSLISALIIVTLVSVIATQLPNSELKRVIVRADQHYINAIGLDQTWGVFAPDPRRSSLDLRATVRYADGSTGTWRLPRAEPFIGNYWDYRWRKWLENVVQESNRDELFEPTAAWIARQTSRDGQRPIRVTLIRRVQPLPPPGKDRDHGPWQQAAYYTLDLKPSDRGERGGR